MIVADASPHPAAAEAARATGAIYLSAPQPNRGAQMNLAAEHATGNVLIFHHADSVLTAADVTAVRNVLRDPETIGGAFIQVFTIWVFAFSKWQDGFSPGTAGVFSRPIRFRQTRNLSRARRFRSHSLDGGYGIFPTATTCLEWPCSIRLCNLPAAATLHLARGEPPISTWFSLSSTSAVYRPPASIAGTIVIARLLVRISRQRKQVLEKLSLG